MPQGGRVRPRIQLRHSDEDSRVITQERRAPTHQGSHSLASLNLRLESKYFCITEIKTREH